MASIIYVGMDVHTTNFTFCCYTADSDRGFAVAQTEPDYRQVIKYMERVQKQRGEECKFVCGYEAGCLGYSPYHQLTRCGVDCVILAPSTMHQEKGKRIKTDRRDAENIARCLAFSLYKANERMQRKYYRIAFKSRHNIAKTAIARELACFVWGMMTGNISNAA